MLIAETAPQPKRWDNPPATHCIDPPVEGGEECGKATYSVEPNFRKLFEAVYCATYEYNNRQVQFLVRLKDAETNEAVEPVLQTIFDDINELSAEEDRDGYIFKPTPHARRNAKTFVSEAYRRMEGNLPRPRVVSDGKGGIIMEWQKDGDVVKLGCVSTDVKRDYIYYRQGNVYDVVEASVDDLVKHLAA